MIGQDKHHWINYKILASLIVTVKPEYWFKKYLLQALPEHGVYTVFVELGNTKIEVSWLGFCQIIAHYCWRTTTMD